MSDIAVFATTFRGCSRCFNTRAERLVAGTGKEELDDKDSELVKVPIGLGRDDLMAEEGACTGRGDDTPILLFLEIED